MKTSNKADIFKQFPSLLHIHLHYSWIIVLSLGRSKWGRKLYWLCLWNMWRWFSVFQEIKNTNEHDTFIGCFSCKICIILGRGSAANAVFPVTHLWYSHKCNWWVAIHSLKGVSPWIIHHLYTGEEIRGHWDPYRSQERSPELPVWMERWSGICAARPFNSMELLEMQRPSTALAYLCQSLRLWIGNELFVKKHL